jgi:hypothetical protein
VPRPRLGAVPRVQLSVMMLNPRTIEQTELDLETSRGQFASLQLDPDVDNGVKLLAAAIAQAGAEIALAITRHGGSEERAGL